MSQAAASSFAQANRRPHPVLLAVIVALHVALFYGLALALTPNIIPQAERTLVAAFNVEEPAPPPPPPAPPPPPPQPQEQPGDEGAQGAPAKAAKARPAPLPKAKIPISKPKPAPPVKSSGEDNRSGGADKGKGTGGAGQGRGTGSGDSAAGAGAGSGSGRGGAGVAVTKPVKIAGDINAARDFPVPPGGRKARWGKSVTVAMTVGPDGRASNCRVIANSVDAEAGQIVCQLATQRFRFRPARNASGNPVAATYGWRQKWNPVN